MRDWIIAGSALALLSIGISWVRRTIRHQRETYILHRKYGDLPMFEDFFQRLKEEQGKGKGRVG